MIDTAAPTLFRARFRPSVTFPDRKLYPMHDPQTGAFLGNLSVLDDGSLVILKADGPAQAFFLSGNNATVDKGTSVVGRTLLVSDAAV